MIEETIGSLPKPLIMIRWFQVYDSVYSTVDAKTVDVINNIFVIANDTS